MECANVKREEKKDQRIFRALLCRAPPESVRAARASGLASSRPAITPPYCALPNKKLKSDGWPVAALAPAWQLRQLEVKRVLPFCT